jgi:tetratricopeptide (TPR) repeat protein
VLSTYRFPIQFSSRCPRYIFRAQCSAEQATLADFGMAYTRIIKRQWARFLLSSPVLFTALVCSLPSSISFADSPLQEHHPLTVPGIDDVLGADRYLSRVQIVEQGQISHGRTEPCILIEHQVQLLEPTPLVPATALCWRVRASTDEIGWPGYEALGDHARSVGSWSEAEQAYAKAIELLEQTAVKDGNQDLAALLNKSGITRFSQKDFAGAETAYRRALTIYTSTRGAADLRVADTLHLLAMALFEQQYGRELAGSLFFRAWAVREQVLGPKHLAVAESLHHLALSLYSNDVSQAIPLLLRSIEIRENTFGHAHPSVADGLMAMAVLYEAHDRRDLAIPLYQEALTIHEKAFGPNATETLQARNNLDRAYRWKGSPSEENKGRE